jgi:transcriptional regulator with XRE-family HTH domain
MMPTSDATASHEQPATEPARVASVAKRYLRLRDLLRMNITIEMRLQGLTKSALASKSGIQYATITNVLIGRNAATIDTVEKLAFALDKNAAALFTRPPDGVYEAALASV